MCVCECEGLRVCFITPQPGCRLDSSPRDVGDCVTSVLLGGVGAEKRCCLSNRLGGRGG